MPSWLLRCLTDLHTPTLSFETWCLESDPFLLADFFFNRLSGYAGCGRCIKGGLIVFANFATWLKMILTQNQCANCSEALFKNDPWWQGQLSST